MTFTQNQTRHFYVATTFDVRNSVPQQAGEISLLQGSEGELALLYMDHDGKIQRTDLIRGGMNTTVEAVMNPAGNQEYHSKATVVTLDSNLLNGGNIINGQDYMLKIRIPQYYVKTDLVNGHKYGIVHGAGNMSASDFYVKMAHSLAMNFCREPHPILKFYITTASDAAHVAFSGTPNVTEITDKTNIEEYLTGGLNVDTFTGIVIDEVEQPWRLGQIEQEPVIYDVNCDYIVYSGEEMIWGKVDKIVGGLTVNNGKQIANMEWYYHGERGDIYREYTYPNNFTFNGFADPSTAYDTVDIHYYWQGANHAIQKSEKDITIAFDSKDPVAAAFIDALEGLTNPVDTTEIEDITD